MREWKKYRLDNGDVLTSKQLAEKINISVNCARVRLCTYTDPDKIYNRKTTRRDHSSKAINPHPKYLQNKMLYDQSEAGKLMRLALKTI